MSLCAIVCRGGVDVRFACVFKLVCMLFKAMLCGCPWTRCPAGTYSNVTEATSSSACVACPYVENSLDNASEASQIHYHGEVDSDVMSVCVALVPLPS